MSPIFVRPVREQLEHDRLIRFLQTKYKRKFDVAINVGDEQVAPVKLGTNTFFPDLVLTDGKKLGGLVEVETGESVNNLEAMAQWVHFSRARVPFHLYVPVQGYDAARRLCEHHRASVAEIWTYRPSMDGFDLVRMFHDAAAVASGARESRKAAAAQAAAGKPEFKPARSAPVKEPEPARAPKPAAARAANSTKATPTRAANGKDGAAKGGAAKNGVAKNGGGKPARSARPAKPAKPPVAASPKTASKSASPKKGAAGKR